VSAEDEIRQEFERLAVLEQRLAAVRGLALSDDDSEAQAEVSERIAQFTYFDRDNIGRRSWEDPGSAGS